VRGNQNRVLIPFCVIILNAMEERRMADRLIFL